MKTYLDTNILYYTYSGKNLNINFDEKKITSINTLEFLKNIEKIHNNKAKYYIPRINSDIHYQMLLEGKKYFKKRNHPINKRLSDYVIFDFAQDFDSYALYNNESIAQIINNKYRELFYLTISFLSKSEYKEIRGKFDFLVDNELQCDSINSNDIELGYELLDIFTQKHSLKDDFRNCWNDILILSKSINEGARLITSDKLLNRFASELYEGKIVKSAEILEIQFPCESEKNDKYVKQESKGYINRGWIYKMNKGK
jgi:hypothetical protein